MPPLSYLLLPTLAMLSITHAGANAPSYLNSNNINNALPSSTLPAAQQQAIAPAATLPQEQQQTFTLNTLLQLDNVLIEGGSVYPFSEIAAVFNPYIGQEVTLGQLAMLTNRITQRYQDDGYALSYAVIPAQDLSQGQVRVILVEGYISAHEMQGDIGKVEKQVSKLAAKLINERPLRKASFERYTSLMAQIPGVSLQANVPPPTTTDGAVTLITTGSRKGFTASSSISNSADNDDVKILLSATSSSQTALGEQVTVSTILPPGDDKERYARLDYSQFVGDEGTRLNTSVAGYRSKPGERDTINIENVPIELATTGERKNDRVSVGLTHPFIASSSESLTGSASLYAVNDELDGAILASSSFGQEQLKFGNSSKVRALAVEGEWKQASAEQLRVLGGGLYQGLDVLGAESQVRLADGSQFSPHDIHFLRARLNALQQDAFTERWIGVATGALYWSEDSLPSSEQVLFGDRNFGRGYPAEQAYGDKGWGAGYELGYQFYPGLTWLQLLQPYGAVDAARTRFNDNGQDANLASYALGVRLSDLRHYNVALELAQPLADAPIDNDRRDPRLNFSINYNL